MASGDGIDPSTAWLWAIALPGIGVAGLVAGVDGVVRWRRARAAVAPSPDAPDARDAAGAERHAPADRR